MSEQRLMVEYDTNKRTASVAYLYLLFLGVFGAHRFYLGRKGSGSVMLILSFVGFLLLATQDQIGLICLLVVGLWLIIDFFNISKMTRTFNQQLAYRLGL